MVPWGPLHELRGGTSTYRPVSTKMLSNLIIHKLFFFSFNPGAELVLGRASAGRRAANPAQVSAEEGERNCFGNGFASVNVLVMIKSTHVCG